MLFRCFSGQAQKLPYFPSHVLPTYIITKATCSSPSTTHHVKENWSLKIDLRENLPTLYIALHIDTETYLSM